MLSLSSTLNPTFAPSKKWDERKKITLTIAKKEETTEKSSQQQDKNIKVYQHWGGGATPEQRRNGI